MKDQDIRFLKSVFAEYYSRYSDAVYVPPPVNSREIGFSVWPERSMVRHMSFASLAEVRDYIINNTPSDAYHSCAVYESPEKPMGYKTELWTDLAFDVDAKGILPDCIDETTYSLCKTCGLRRKGRKKKCPKCSRENYIVEFINLGCLSVTAGHTRRLCSALMNKIGIDSKDIAVYFSGHMGFHVYVTSRAIGELDHDARREIASYLALDGVLDGALPDKPGELRMIRPTVAGRKVLSELLDIVANPRKHEDILGKEGIRIIQENKREALPSLEKGFIGGLSNLLGTPRTKKLLRRAWQEAAIVVDPSVTMDVHRVFRMPGTLNSKSGLPKQLVPLDKIDVGVLSIIPEYGRAEVQVSVSFAPKVVIGQDKVGPFSNEKAVVPRYIAAYLILKGVASVG